MSHCGTYVRAIFFLLPFFISCFVLLFFFLLFLFFSYLSSLLSSPPAFPLLLLPSLFFFSFTVSSHFCFSPSFKDPDLPPVRSPIHVLTCTCISHTCPDPSLFHVLPYFARTLTLILFTYLHLLPPPAHISSHYLHVPYPLSVLTGSLVCAKLLR